MILSIQNKEADLPVTHHWFFCSWKEEQNTQLWELYKREAKVAAGKLIGREIIW